MIAARGARKQVVQSVGQLIAVGGRALAAEEQEPQDSTASVPTRLQPHTPFFVPPEIATKQQKLQDQITDIYKLGLCIIRGLSSGRGSTQVADPASPLLRPGLLDQAGIDLLNRAIGVDRDQRPTAEEIKNYLIGRILHLAVGSG